MWRHADVDPRASPATLASRYHAVRARSQALCAPLCTEDHVPQPSPEVSPPKWHLAHTTWFFEALVLRHARPAQAPYHPSYDHLFNSYYESLGQRVARESRGTLSRPTVAEALSYRAHVDRHMLALLAQAPAPELHARVELGLQHEQQHQELLLTDIKYILGHNPLRPPYARPEDAPVALDEEHPTITGQARWLAWPGGMVDIGHPGDGFAFDNESARHTVYLPPFELSDQRVSNAQYLAFMEDGGYRRFEFWHAEAWDWLHQSGVSAPLYWWRSADDGGRWWHYTLGGPAPLPPEAPVTHLSYYEAYAYAQWAGQRLPTEFEWEALADGTGWDGPGARWDWTESAYLPYPGFRKAAGALGEYNGKFMVNQKVLRGASFATPPGHARRTYRNFFHPPLRWQYSGLRLARS